MDSFNQLKRILFSLDGLPLLITSAQFASSIASHSEVCLYPLVTTVNV